MDKALLLLAHGSRSSNWPLFFYELQKSLVGDSKGEKRVFIAFLQFTSPTFLEALQEVYSLDYSFVYVWPLFLGVGSHVKEDVPVIVQEGFQKFPQMDYEVLPALGEDASFVKQLASYGQKFLH